MARGGLSEWFGAAALPIDRFTRMLGLYRAAQKQYDALSPELRAVLDAYAAGVNAFLATRRGALPPEYYLIGAAPEPWTPGGFAGLGQDHGFAADRKFPRRAATRAAAATGFAGDLDVLYPPYPDDAPARSRASARCSNGLPPMRSHALLPPGDDQPVRASNNWVVVGQAQRSRASRSSPTTRISTFAAPGIWYLARIETPALDLAGVTAPGAPFIVIGHNDRIAWGFTTTASDVEDLFIEKPDPDDPSRYLAPGGSLPFDTRREEIAGARRCAGHAHRSVRRGTARSFPISPA